MISFDIETEGLDPRLHKVFLFSYREKGQPNAFDVFHGRNESQVLNKINDFIKGVEHVVTWNGEKFDIPFLRKRMIVLGMEPQFGHLIHTDLMLVARNRYGLKNNDQNTWAQRFGISSNDYPFDKRIWASAAIGNPLAQRYVEQHGYHDVRVLDSLLRNMFDGIE